MSTSHHPLDASHIKKKKTGNDHIISPVSVKQTIRPEKQKMIISCV